MASYLMDAMCANREYPSLSWTWNLSLSSIHVYWKMIWENTDKEDYERICNGLFAPNYQIIFWKEAPYLSLERQEIMQKYSDWYMTPDGVYIRVIGSTKATNWISHFIPNKLLLQEMAYPFSYLEHYMYTPSWSLFDYACLFIQNLKQCLGIHWWPKCVIWYHRIW